MSPDMQKSSAMADRMKKLLEIKEGTGRHNFTPSHSV